MKRILLTLSVCFFVSQFLFAQTVWNGPVISFGKTAFANPALAANQDRITATTWITRANTMGIYNAFSETAYTNNMSPSNTEWATGTLANYATLGYQSWEVWAGGQPNVPSIVGRNAVVHLIAENIYIGIKFTGWGVGGGAGGSFSYERTTANVVAPVKLTGFTATRQNTTVAVKWTTAAEENTASFSVEKSTDGRSFSAIGTVPAAGNSATERTYAFTDAAPAPLNFYRLRTNDKNGSIAYSKVVALKTDAGKSLQIFPVPASQSLHVQAYSKAEARLQLVDVDGTVLKLYNLTAGNSAFTLDISTLKPGSYFLRTATESKAFVKQ